MESWTLVQACLCWTLVQAPGASLLVSTHVRAMPFGECHALLCVFPVVNNCPLWSTRICECPIFLSLARGERGSIV